VLANVYQTFEEGLDFPDLRAARKALEPPPSSRTA
jgi:hypothetical protein